MRLFIRCIEGEVQLGPGKIRLLELIDGHGSISEAARAMDMSYRRAWLLVADLNKDFREPVTSTQTGGKGGGHAKLTEFGRDLIQRYRTIERDAAAAVADQLSALNADIARP
ncbi:MAG: putative transcriptional regulatory protein LysR family [Rhodospirillales bacterium]|nr:putative transcriptional regulatory protein LysR family [Rhodospirillales bacterium]